jgi:hypothetical protein
MIIVFLLSNRGSLLEKIAGKRPLDKRKGKG